MSIDDFPFWSVVFAPIGIALQKIFSHSSRIATLESEISAIKEDLEKIDTLCDDVSYIKGLLDEHLRK